MTPEARIDDTRLAKPFGNKVDPPPPHERWVALWRLTPEGRQTPGKVYDTLIMASEALQKLGGMCNLYVMTGISETCDFIGYAQPRDAKTPINEMDMLALHRAVEASGVLQVTLLKAEEVGYTGLKAHVEKINKIGNP